MAFNLNKLREHIKDGTATADLRDKPFIDLFGSKREFNNSIMSPVPMITNKWELSQYLNYHKRYGILQLRSFEEWCHPDDAYKYYKSRLQSGSKAQYTDSPDSDQFDLINYREFCDEIGRLSNEINHDLNEYGVTDIQSLIGSYQTVFFILKRFRKHFYSSLYTFSDNSDNSVYQKSPLRHLLVFLIDKRLARLIPNSDTFKYSKSYFETLDYRKAVSESIYNHLIDKYTSDMIACKFLF